MAKSAFMSQIKRVKMKSASGSDNFHSHFILKLGGVPLALYHLLLARAYEEEELDYSGLLWNIAFAEKPGRNYFTIKGYRDIMICTHDWKLISGCVALQLQRAV